MKQALLVAERRDSVLKMAIPKIDAASARKQRSVVVMFPNRPEWDYPPDYKGERIQAGELPKELDNKLACRVQLAFMIAAAGLFVASWLMMNAGMILPSVGCIAVMFLLMQYSVDENFAARLTRPAGAAYFVWDYCKRHKLKPRMVRVGLVGLCSHGLRASYQETIVITANW